MITLRDLQQEAKFGQKLDKLLQTGKITEAMKVADEHERLINIRQEFRCSEITKYMTEEHKELTNLHLRKICILSDIVEGAGIDMLELLRKYDEHLSLPLVALLNNLKRTAREINKIIDATGDYEYRASFGDVCDEIDKRIKDLFEKREI
jgi:dsDNA-specific endonuclease/ATPase MutS2